MVGGCDAVEAELLGLDGLGEQVLGREVLLEAWKKYRVVAMASDYPAADWPKPPPERC